MGRKKGEIRGSNASESDESSSQRGARPTVEKGEQKQGKDDGCRLLESLQEENTDRRSCSGHARRGTLHGMASKSINCCYSSQNS
jgi:hypothetical protein